jgi:MFS family permease
VLANLANLLFFIGFTTFFVLPVHLESLGASRSEIGRVMGSFGVASVLAIPATGLFVDRFGRRPFLIAGALLWALAAALFSTVHELGPFLYVLRMVQGVAFALAFVATNGLIVDLAPRQALGRAISIFGTTTLATHAIGPALGELLLRTFGFRALCAQSAAGATAAIGIGLMIREAPRPAPETKAQATSTGLLALSLRPGAWSALVGGVASALAFGTAMNFMPIFVKSRQLPSFSPFFTAYVLAAISVRLVAGGLGDRIGHRRVAAFALSVFALVVTGFSQVASTPMLVGLALAFGVTHGWTYPSLNALFLEDVPERARGRAMALFSLSFNVGVLLAAFTGGEIAERFGYSAMWQTMGALSVVGVVALWIDRARPAPPTAW